MKILRLLSLLLLASQLTARAVPTLSLSETWKETVGIAPFESFEITDTYDSAADYYQALPFPPLPDGAPYSGPSGAY